MTQLKLVVSLHLLLLLLLLLLMLCCKQDKHNTRM